MTTRLETERLTLRPWAEADAPALFRAASDPEVGPRAGWDPHRSVEESARIIREVLAVTETYAIVIRGAVPADEPVGAIGLKFGAVSDLARDASEAELGYWIARPQWGRGYVPEACRALLDHAFDDLRLKVVWAGHYDENAQSRRVMEKLGLSEVGAREAQGRPERILRITQAEWKTLSSAGGREPRP